MENVGFPKGIAGKTGKLALRADDCVGCRAVRCVLVSPRLVSGSRFTFDASRLLDGELVAKNGSQVDGLIFRGDVIV